MYFQHLIKKRETFTFHATKSGKRLDYFKISRTPNDAEVYVKKKKKKTQPNKILTSVMYSEEVELIF